MRDVVNKTFLKSMEGELETGQSPKVIRRMGELRMVTLGNTVDGNPKRSVGIRRRTRRKRVAIRWPNSDGCTTMKSRNG